MKTKLRLLRIFINEAVRMVSPTGDPVPSTSQVLFHFDQDEDFQAVVKLFEVDPNDPRVNGLENAPDEDYLIAAASNAGWNEVTVIYNAESLQLQQKLAKILRTTGDMIAVRAMNSGDDFHIFSKRLVPTETLTKIESLSDQYG